MPSSASGSSIASASENQTTARTLRSGAGERERQDGEVVERQPPPLPDRDHDRGGGDGEEDEEVPVWLRRLPLGDVSRDGAVDEQEPVVVDETGAVRRGEHAGPGQRRGTRAAAERLRRALRRGSDEQRRRAASETMSAPRTTEPWTFAQSTSVGKTRSVRRAARRWSVETSASVSAKSGSAIDWARSCHDHGATTRQTIAATSVIRDDAPRTREATIVIASAVLTMSAWKTTASPSPPARKSP